MIILGIDPGVANLGWGIVEDIGNEFKLHNCGILKTSADKKLPARLLILYETIHGLIQQYQPQAMAIETLFFAKNVKTAVTMSHGRGAVLVAAAGTGIEICEYSPIQIKIAVAGYGHAGKEQIQKMVRLMLHLTETPRPPDIADAIAVAICHIQSSKVKNIYNRT